MAHERTPYRGKKRLEERDYDADEFRKEENAVIVKARQVQDTRVYPTLFNECANCGTRYPLIGAVDFDFCKDECVDERIRRSLGFGYDI